MTTSRGLRTALAAALAAALLAAPADAAARPAAPHIVGLRCVTRCGPLALEIGVRGRLRITGRNLRRGVRVVFPTISGSAQPRHAVKGRLASGRRVFVLVPRDAASGRVRLQVGSRRSNAAGPIVVRRPAPRHSAGSADAFSRSGMWIWVLSRSSGGDPAAIAAQARAYGVRTVYLKSADGTSPWSQFSAQTVAALKAGGLRVCGWQYVYGSNPIAEAQAGAAAVAAGADCFVIDAETEYEGRYAQAQTYLAALRNAIGADFPVALAGFPYVDYHPAFPFSVFLGPGGAQANLPQMYWKAIGTTVDGVYAHTVPLNRVYARPIFPLGQLYAAPAASDVSRFVSLAAASGSTGVSWWDWQDAAPSGWAAIGAPAPALAPVDYGWPLLRKGARGDLVVWAQEHLRGAGSSTLAVDGDFGPQTQAAVQAFQIGHGLPATGAIDAATWPSLVAAPVAAPDWTAPTGGATASAARVHGRAPKSAALPARRAEIPSHRGAPPAG